VFAPDRIKAPLPFLVSVPVAGDGTAQGETAAAVTTSAPLLVMLFGGNLAVQSLVPICKAPLLITTCRYYRHPGWPGSNCRAFFGQRAGACNVAAAAKSELLGVVADRDAAGDKAVARKTFVCVVLSSKSARTIKIVRGNALEGPVICGQVPVIVCCARPMHSQNSHGPEVNWS